MSAFAGKVAVITGGTRGIGRAISLHLLAKGATVFALYARDRKGEEELLAAAGAAAPRLHCIRGDLTDEKSLAATVADLKAKAPEVHFLLHCAASGVHKDALALTMRHLRWTFDINFFAVHALVRELVPTMPAGGRVIALTSGGGERVLPHYAAVGASKGALESLFRHYAVEFAPRGIAANLVCPGMVMTDAVEAFPEKEARVERTLKATPSGRLTTPEEVAALVGFLCTAEASQIVGQTLVLDGGRLLPN